MTLAGEIEKLVGIRYYQLTTDEGTLCREIVRRGARTSEERMLLEALEELVAGKITPVHFKRLVQLTASSDPAPAVVPDRRRPRMRTRYPLILSGLLAAILLGGYLGCVRVNKRTAGEEAIAKAGELVRRMCECSDASCADRVEEQLRAWGAEQPGGDLRGITAEMSDAEAKKFREAIDEYAKCLNKRRSDEAIAKLGELADEMCKCSDEVCAEKVAVTMKAWRAEQANRASDDEPSDEDRKKLTAATDKYRKCLIVPVLAKMGELADNMCKCSDNACADSVMEALNKWAAEQAKKASSGSVKPSDEDRKTMTEVTEKFGRCMMKAMGGGSGPPKP